MHPTAQIKSTRNHNKIIVNVSIQIPLKNKIPLSYREQEDSISPNRFKKKDKIVFTPNQYKQTVHTSNIHSGRNTIHAQLIPSKKKYSSIHHYTDKKSKLQLPQFSPKKRNYQTSRKLRDKSIMAKDMSILQQVLNEDDNIIKYTSNSNQIKEKYQDSSLGTKIHTNISDLDLNQIRKIQNQAKQTTQKIYLTQINDFLRNACAKKIQRVWRNYKTKKLIRSYSDIKNKYKRDICVRENILNVKSQGVSLVFKKQLKVYQQLAQPKEDEDKGKIEDDNIQKWQSLLQHIKNKKQLFQNHSSYHKNKDFFNDRGNKKGQDQKIIKTKKYYEAQRQKWREPKSSNAKNKVNYFENQLLKLQNDYSDSDRSGLSSIDDQNMKKKEQFQNIRLKKKLQIFKNHLPDIPVLSFEKQTLSSKLLNKDISNYSVQNKFQQEINDQSISIQVIQVNYEQFSDHEDKALIQVNKLHLQQKPSSISLEQDTSSPINQLKQQIISKDNQINQILLEQLILQTLVQISSSKKLNNFLSSLTNKKKMVKPEGIVTNQSSIRDYLQYFINYIYQSHKEQQIYKNLITPAGPSPFDALRYSRGYQIDYNPSNQYIMGLQLFNQHWQHANELIYFDQKWEDQKKQEQRIYYLKQLTKIFFRAIFDCFNQALDHERIYGLRGKPYPWNNQNTKIKTPTLKRCLLVGLQRVLKISSVLAGVLFEDKIHELNKQIISEVQQANMLKLVMLEMKDEQFLWMFIEDELLQLRLKLSKHIQTILLKEIIVFIRSKL